MKKLMIGFAVVCAAAVTQAASVNWSLTGITDSPAAAKAAGWVAYFLDGSTRDAFDALTGDQVAAYAASKAIDSTTTTSGRTGVMASKAYGNFNPGDSVSGYVVIFDASSASAAKNYAVTTVINDKIPGAGNLNMAWAFGTTTGNGWTSTAPIPEPTTVALLALGLAAVGLKRKVA